ncbi:MAG: 4-hydroxy-tetrahydrodipicolinate synthase [Planctomycetes bacterium]|nr:4-hydroxy-tetrahydrodipicolinate synthase [Planctomycetota bacterium]
MFHGLFVALITPFTSDDTIDRVKLRSLVDFHLEQGTSGLVLCGTTGESGCLDADEWTEVLDVAVQAASGRLQVIAGAGARSTRETVKNVKTAWKTGADGVLVVTPFYNRPGQEGLFHHFRAVAETCDVPVMLYNVPSRTGVDLIPDTVARLSETPNIIAIKEAKPDIDRLTELTSCCGDRLDVLTGHDPNLLPALCVGCKGLVSVAGNFVPRDLINVIRLFESGETSQARQLHQKLFPLCRALAVDTNPVPVKEALNLLGWEVGTVRPPLLPLNEEKRIRLKKALSDYGLLKEAIPN